VNLTKAKPQTINISFINPENKKRRSGTHPLWADDEQKRLSISGKSGKD
jgi:hypothetical protein